jgi:hypothetical protein
MTMAVIMEEELDVVATHQIPQDMHKMDAQTQCGHSCSSDTSQSATSG